MFKPENKIIIVDDNQEHLDTLAEPFLDNGIGCKSLLYDVSYNTPLKNIRVAFFDIRINPTGGSSSGQRLNDIATAIKQYIHIDNGPFALIFWTSNKNDIDEIKKFIQERHSDCPKPFHVDFIDKDVFLNNPENLVGKLETILSDETLEILFELEDVSARSASKTLNQLYNIIPSNDNWGESQNFKENFNTIFSKIAISSLGFGHAKNNPDAAINEALLPILGHHFLKSSNETTTWRSILTKLAGATKSSDIPDIAGFNESVLNTIFHVDESPNITPITRGAVLEYRFYPQEAQRYNYFERLNVESRNLFSRFIQFSNTIAVQEKDNFISSSKWIAIEISSACDFSQNKPRNHKYVLALLTPDIEIDKIDRDKISESVYYKDLPVIAYDKKDCRIWINFNFSFSDFETNDHLGRPLFLLKKELMDLIGNRYANHISRIGITSFF